MTDCLVGCIGQHRNGDIRKPIDGENLAPFVIAKFTGANTTITVGNKSAPDLGNNVIIKSMEYGSEDGNKVTIELHDQEGQAFETFIGELAKCISQDNSSLEVEFGWINSACGGGGGIVEKSDKLRFIPRTGETSFAQGKIRVRIIGTDVAQDIEQTRGNLIFGNDKDTNGMIPLKQAIEQMFADPRIPPVADVKFVRRDCASGAETEIEKFVTDKNEEPLCVWRMNGESKLLAAYEWIRPFKTDAGKGVTAFSEPKISGNRPLIKFFEDPSPLPDESNCVGGGLGTYIVNGGNCSSVIEFSPTIEWTWGHLGKSGGFIGTGSAETGQRQGMEEGRIIQAPSPEGVGVETSAPNDSYATCTYGPREAVKKSQEAESHHQKANNSKAGIPFPIEAELRVQGDPKFVSPAQLIGRKIGIVAINPFHLFGGDACGDWLALPGCNTIFSNNSWQVMGVNHMIKEGSYVTTFKVRLDVPGSTVSPDAPLGGFGASGIPSKSLARKPC